MNMRQMKKGLHPSLGFAALSAALASFMVACSSDVPTVSQVPSTIEASNVALGSGTGVSLYYDGVKSVVTPEDAAVIFSTISLGTDNTQQIIDFSSNVLGVELTAAQVETLGSPSSIKISDFTGDGQVNADDAAVLFAAAQVGTDATRINTFVANVLKVPGISVTQAGLDPFFSAGLLVTPSTLTITQPSDPNDSELFVPTEDNSFIVQPPVAPENGILVVGVSNKLGTILPDNEPTFRVISAPGITVTGNNTSNPNITFGTGVTTAAKVVVVPNSNPGGAGTTTIQTQIGGSTTATNFISGPSGTVELTVVSPGALIDVSNPTITVAAGDIAEFGVKLSARPEVGSTVTIRITTEQLPDPINNATLLVATKGAAPFLSPLNTVQVLTFTPDNFNKEQVVQAGAVITSQGAAVLDLTVQPQGTTSQLFLTQRPEARVDFIVTPRAFADVRNFSVDPGRGTATGDGTPVNPFKTFQQAFNANFLPNGSTVAVTNVPGAGIAEPVAGVIQSKGVTFKGAPNYALLVNAAPLTVAPGSSLVNFKGVRSSINVLGSQLILNGGSVKESSVSCGPNSDPCVLVNNPAGSTANVISNDISPTTNNLPITLVKVNGGAGGLNVTGNTINIGSDPAPGTQSVVGTGLDLGLTTPPASVTGNTFNGLVTTQVGGQNVGNGTGIKGGLNAVNNVLPPNNTFNNLAVNAQDVIVTPPVPPVPVPTFAVAAACTINIGGSLTVTPPIPAAQNFVIGGQTLTPLQVPAAGGNPASTIFVLSPFGLLQPPAPVQLGANAPLVIPGLVVGSQVKAGGNTNCVVFKTN
ncbi:MAG: hypothetical protein HC924_12685 [Synechococcaceae cyanobacterium SM2_3_2]|nr:hypothetical protein [Synechococcaceae cyanobacterium SM2_3_2]